MGDFWIFLIVVGAWFVLQTWLLPKMGVHT